MVGSELVLLVHIQSYITVAGKSVALVPKNLQKYTALKSSCIRAITLNIDHISFS